LPTSGGQEGWRKNTLVHEPRMVKWRERRMSRNGICVLGCKEKKGGEDDHFGEYSSMYRIHDEMCRGGQGILPLPGIDPLRSRGTLDTEKELQ
jgi:hypothetical protein